MKGHDRQGPDTRPPAPPTALPPPTGLPGLVSPELHFRLQLLLPHPGLLGLPLLLQEEGRPLLGEFVFRLLFILQSRYRGRHGMQPRPTAVPSADGDTAKAQSKGRLAPFRRMSEQIS